MQNISENKQLDEFELDQLKEVINIGASHASTALSQLVKKRIKVTMPEIHVAKVEEMVEIIGREKEVITAILLKILGEAPGSIVYIFPHNKSTCELISMISGREVDIKKTFSEFDISVLKEVGNILAGASLTAFSKFLDVNLLQSVSDAITDMLGSVINTLAVEIAVGSDVALIFRVSFQIEGREECPELFFFIDPSSTSVILESTRQKIVNK